MSNKFRKEDRKIRVYNFFDDTINIKMLTQIKSKTENQKCSPLLH